MQNVLVPNTVRSDITFIITFSAGIPPGTHPMEGVVAAKNPKIEIKKNTDFIYTISEVLRDLPFNRSATQIGCLARIIK
jgi:hypothetical protein